MPRPGTPELAARRALEDLGGRPDWFLMEGQREFLGCGPTRTIVHDRVCLSIATASVATKGHG